MGKDISTGYEDNNVSCEKSMKNNDKGEEKENQETKALHTCFYVKGQNDWQWLK